MVQPKTTKGFAVAVAPADETLLRNMATIDAARLALYDEHIRQSFDSVVNSYTQSIKSPKEALAAVERFNRIWFSELLAPYDCKIALAAALVDVILPYGGDIDVGFLRALAHGDADTVDSVLIPIRA
jgi:hypothetical protein